MEFRKFYAKIKFGISAHFFRKKRRERGNLSAKMDSRFRGNDGGEGGNLSARIGRRRGRNSEKNGGIRRKKSPQFPPKKTRHSRRKQEKPPSFPRKRESILRNKTANLPRFHKKMRGNSKINRPEWIPAFAGMTAGRAGIRRRK